MKKKSQQLIVEQDNFVGGHKNFYNCQVLHLGVSDRPLGFNAYLLDPQGLTDEECIEAFKVGSVKARDFVRQSINSIRKNCWNRKIVKIIFINLVLGESNEKIEETIARALGSLVGFREDTGLVIIGCKTSGKNCIKLPIEVLEAMSMKPLGKNHYAFIGLL